MSRWKKLRNGITPIAAVLALAIAILAVFGPGIWQQEATAATQSNRISILCINCTGTGAQPQNRVHGGLNVITASCTGDFPDGGIDVEARDHDSHPWLPVQGVDTFTADARQTNLFGFADNTAVRVVITDAAPAHVCLVTASSIGK